MQMVLEKPAQKRYDFGVCPEVSIEEIWITLERFSVYDELLYYLEYRRVWIKGT